MTKSRNIRSGTPEERLMRRVCKDDNGCWIWMGSTSGRHEYGTIFVNGKPLKTHRFAYELFVGPIPDGMVIDHKCRVHRCCNPKHLEPVSQRDNVLRGDLFKEEGHEREGKSTCKNGHQWGTVATYKGGKRECAICIKNRSPEKNRRRREKRRLKKLAGPCSSVPFRAMLRGATVAL